MAIGATIAIEVLILLVLLTLGMNRAPLPAERTALTTFDARPETSEAEAEAEPASEPETAQAQPTPSPQEEPSPAPSAPPALALPRPNVPVISVPAPPAEPPAEPAPEPQSSIRAVVRDGATYGPPDTGRPGPPDSEVVGTAPDGSPLYAARWYREPYQNELAGYLSTARGPGWGLIVCRTAPNWRVEDCEILGENPQGSGIARAANAAAWQFQVRPPRVDGEYQVGAWVRIRLNYGTGRGPGGG